MVYKLPTILSLLIVCSGRVNSFFFTPTASPGCLSDPRYDCYTPGSTVTQAQCTGINCKWCTESPSLPFCVDSCDVTNGIDCFSTPTSGVTLTTCNNRNVCKFCNNVPSGQPICQTNYNDCLVAGRVDAKPTGTAVTRQSCENVAPTGLYCPHRVAGMPWCIVAQPAPARCFNTAQTAFTTATDQCNCQRQGGLWCTSAPNANRCISLPTAVTTACPPAIRYQCFPSGVVSPTQAQCEAVGCSWCTTGGPPNCIHAMRTTACPAPGK